MGERRPEDIARRAILIYEQSISEAKGAAPEYLEYGSDERSVIGSSRAGVQREYAADMGVDFAQVRCTRKYARVDFGAIGDKAADFACVDPADIGELPVAYTWEGEGWQFEDCEADDPGAIAFWHCELKPKVEATECPGEKR